ncbi:MAG TPA: Mut7-C RNAse domain-containing protein [Chthoniobacterales bacterium]
MNSLGEGNAFTIHLHFDRELCFFLSKRIADGEVVRCLREKTSIKDVIESCGVPHTEVHAIVSRGATIDFAFQISADADVCVYGLAETQARNFDSLQRCGATRFVADGHLGKLARDLRLLGFDVAYAANTADAELVRIATTQDRALLTRDRRLLMHRVLRDGYCLRSTDPDEQLFEVLHRFDIAKDVAPFARCIRCNGELVHVTKGEVLHQLEPLTKLYYEDFRRCTACGGVYWAGSHFSKLEARVAQVRARQLPQIELEQ